MDMSTPFISKDRSEKSYIGRTLHNVPLPSCILDISKIKTNCKLMLDTVHELGIGFRAHVKTHKTEELVRYQIGHNSRDVRLIVSTVNELEELVPLCLKYRSQGAVVNVLYGIPLGQSHIMRLTQFLVKVGVGSLTLMVDHVAQLASLSAIYVKAQLPVKVFLKTDSGYHRAGVPPESQSMEDLVQQTLRLEMAGVLHVLGFYSHNSLTYGGNSPAEAIDNLRAEVDACTRAAVANLGRATLSTRSEPITISCGASPTALSLQNLVSSQENQEVLRAAELLKKALANARTANVNFEIHAGVYSVMDVQQVAASSRQFASTEEAYSSIAITVLTEVCSLYPSGVRTAHAEALINAGTLALAREPCKDYRGHGIITSWNMPDTYDAYKSASRIIVDRVSQEHGILQWDQKEAEGLEKTIPLPLEYGQRLRIWPNHACITGSQYKDFLIVDSESDDPDTVKDVWTRWTGW